MKKKNGLSLPIQGINILIALLFFSFAWFQRNDVDPQIYHNPSNIDAALWLFFYLLIAILLIIVIWRKIPVWILLLATIACVVQMAVSGPGLFQNLFGNEDFSMTGESMSAESPQVELSREFFGAVIALLGVIWIWLQHRAIGGSKG